MTTYRRIKRSAVWLAMVIVSCLWFVLLVPPLRLLLVGLIRQETFYGGRPASYWSAEIEKTIATGGMAAISPSAQIPIREAKFVSQGGITTLEQPEVTVRALQDPICLRRSDAAAELLLSGPSAVPVLTELLQDENARVRAAAAWGLGRAGERATEAVPALTNLLQDNHPAKPVFGTVSEAAARALKRIQAEAGRRPG